MDSNDFGGKIVVFGNSVCRKGKTGEKVDHLGVSQPQRAWHGSSWKRGHIMLTCVGLSTFSKDWKRTNESKPGENDSKAWDLLLKAKRVCSQVTGFLLLDFPRI